MRRQVTDWLVYLLVRVLICVVQTMQIETCHAFARLLALIACDLLRLRHSVVDENLRHVFPGWTDAQRKRLERRMWEHLALMVFEIAHVPRKIHDTTWRRYVSLHRADEIVRCLLQPRPTVVVSGHFGNFEVAGYMAGLLGFPSFTIARPLDNRHLDRFVNDFRRSKGQHILPKQGSSAEIDGVLRSGGILSLLGDQYAGPKGCWVDFLGRPASCHKALALFALAGDAPLMVSYARRLRRPLEFEVGLVGVADPRLLSPEQAAVKPLTQWYNCMLEQVIRRAPDQYWWVHRRWKGAPARRTKRQPRPTDTVERAA